LIAGGAQLREPLFEAIESHLQLAMQKAACAPIHAR